MRKMWASILWLSLVLLLALPVHAKEDIVIEGTTVPPFHSSTLIQWWSQSIFRSMDPHLLTAILAFILAGGGWLVYKAIWKRQDDTEWLMDEEERRFLDLYHQYQTLFAKLTELQKKMDAGQINAEEFAQIKASYKEKLVNINMELKQLVS